MDSQTFFDNFETIANAPGGVSQLRDLILDLAVRGKLVPQVVSDQASTLDNCEGTFEIPTSWRWAPLYLVAGDLGQEVPKTKFHYIDVGSINSNIGCISDDVAILKSSEAPSRARKKVELGTVLYSTVRPYLRNIAIIDREFQPKAIASTAFAVLHPNECIDSKFLFVCVRSPYFTIFVESKQKGVAYPAINASDLKEALIPLPPFDEQKRIVAKVDELMELCDELEAGQNQRNSIRTAARKSAIDAISTATTPDELNAAWNRISDNWLTIADAPESISSLRSLILDLAIKGKLVEQKKNENRPDYEEVDGLYEIWDNWIWTSLDKIGIVNPRNSGDDDSDAGFVPMTHVQTSISASHGFEVRKWSSIKKGYTHLSDGDVAVAKITPCFENGKACIVQNLPNGLGAGTTELLVVRPNGVLPEYILIYLKSPLFRENGIPQMTGTAGQKRLPTGFFKTFPIPLPPKAEQKRVAAKVDELMALCDQLELSLAEQDELAKKIAGAMTTEVAA